MNNIQKRINVALIGQGFMGRTHSNAWGQVAKFFKPPLQAVMHTVFGQAEENPQAFAENWGWQNAVDRLASNWSARRTSAWSTWSRPTTCTPRLAKAAIAAGKPCSCEKPIAGSLADAREMVEAATQGQRQDLRLVQLPPRARPSAWPIAWSRKAAGRRSATCGRPTCRTGPTRSVPLLWRFDKNVGRLRRPRRSERPHHRHGPLRHRPGDHRSRRGDRRDVHSRQRNAAHAARLDRRHRRRAARAPAARDR